LHEPTLNLSAHAWIFSRLSIASVAGKQQLSEVVYFAKDLIIGQLGRRTVTTAKYNYTFHFLQDYVFNPYLTALNSQCSCWYQSYCQFKCPSLHLSMTAFFSSSTNRYIERSMDGPFGQKR